MKNLILTVSFGSVLASILVASQLSEPGNTDFVASPSPSPLPEPTICAVARPPVPIPTPSPFPGQQGMRELRWDNIKAILQTMDQDCDGISDFDDNCARVPNPDQKDRNKNGIGDACEASASPSPSPSPQPTIGCVVTRMSRTTPTIVPTPQPRPTITPTPVPIQNRHMPTLQTFLEISKTLDFDCDGISNYDDNCSAVANRDQKDRNKNGIGDACEISASPSPSPSPTPVATISDGTETLEPLPSVWLPGANSLRRDTINNLLKREDQDGDGVSDADDNCVRVPNPNQKDRNKNGIGDACEVTRKAKPAHRTGCTIPGGYVPKPTASPNPQPNEREFNTVNELSLDDIDNISKGMDYDCDGVSDFKDNCVRAWNPNQKDRNKNGIGDACEIRHKRHRTKQRN